MSSSEKTKDAAPSPSFKASAVPFQPKLSAASFQPGVIAAAPFVPGGKSPVEAQKVAALSAAVKAAPFVPKPAGVASGSSIRVGSPAPTSENAAGSNRVTPDRWWKGGRGDGAYANAVGGGGGGGGGGGRGRGGGRGGGGGASHLSSASSMGGTATFSPYGALSGPSSSHTGMNVIPTYRQHEQYAVGSGRAALAVQFVSDSLKHQMQERSYINQSQWAGSEEAGFPDKIQNYHTLYPLDDDPTLGSNSEGSVALGLRTILLKGISSVDGLANALRRIDGKQVIPSSDLLSQSRLSVDAWSGVSNHPNLVGLRAVFVSTEVDNSAAMFFVHDFHPGAVSLTNAHLVPRLANSGVVSLSPPTEDQLWSYLVQLASALRSVHSAGLALRHSCLHPSKVLLTGFGRLRVGSIGVQEALSMEREDREDLHLLHRQDLTAVGQLLLSLACSGVSSVPSLDVCASHFSMEFTRIVAALCSSAEGGALATWRQLAGAVADRTLAEMDAASLMNDNMLSELSKECENGRLLRLLTKFGFVNERPELKGDSQWSETGDRYLLKLFRDYLFHQYSPEDGSPLVDWGHVMEALNKLDAGVPEKVLLISRDEASMLVVSYGDLKKCLSSAYTEIKTAQ